MVANTIGNTQAEQLEHLRELLGETTFQRIQRDVWQQFSFKAAPMGSNGVLAPLALFAVWDELLQALCDAVTRVGRDNELASRPRPTDGLLWELLKDGVTWSATLWFRRDRGDWEVSIRRSGMYHRFEQFATSEKAEAWADKECIEISMGWKS